jgi:hypothetical protein
VHWPRWIRLSPGDAHHAQRRDSTRRQLKKSSTEKFHWISPSALRALGRCQYLNDGVRIATLSD